MDFWEIHDTYYSRVLRFVRSLVGDPSAADDVVQETFLRAFQHLGQVRDPSKVSSWIFSIAYHVCQDHFRKHKGTLGEQPAPESGPELAEEPSIQEEIDQRRMSACVQEKIHLLPLQLRSVILLADTMELSCREVAEILHLSEANVRVRLHRARKKLREVLEKECSFEIDRRGVLVCEPVKTKQGTEKPEIKEAAKMVNTLSALDRETQLLVAVGSAVAAGCMPCLEKIVGMAREEGVDERKVKEAVLTGQYVKEQPNRMMREFADGLTGTHLMSAPPSAEGPCLLEKGGQGRQAPQTGPEPDTRAQGCGCGCKE
ncbi:MAG: sigma-70 family RNA polymerase sigma factor [bacterium]